MTVEERQARQQEREHLVGCVADAIATACASQWAGETKTATASIKFNDGTTVDLSCKSERESS